MTSVRTQAPPTQWLLFSRVLPSGICRVSSRLHLLKWSETMLRHKKSQRKPIQNPTQPQGAGGSQPTTSLHDPLPTNHSYLELWCLIKGDSIVFPVTLLDKASIAHLKDLIWEKGRNDVSRDVDPKNLVLWKVSDKGLADSWQLTS